MDYLKTNSDQVSSSNEEILYHNIVPGAGGAIGHIVAGNSLLMSCKPLCVFVSGALDTNAFPLAGQICMQIMEINVQIHL